MNATLHLYIYKYIFAFFSTTTWRLWLIGRDGDPGDRGGDRTPQIIFMEGRKYGFAPSIIEEFVKISDSSPPSPPQQFEATIKIFLKVDFFQRHP